MGSPSHCIICFLQDRTGTATVDANAGDSDSNRVCHLEIQG